MADDVKTCGGCAETKTVGARGGLGTRSARRRPSAERASSPEYGLAPEDWDGMFERQGRACAACGSTEPRDRQGRWATDHDHATGEVRGILRGSCNLALGHLKDDPARIRALLAYLGAAGA